jgi:hypothetical protein
MPLLQKAGIVDRRVQANAGDHILQHAPARIVIEHIARHDPRHARRGGEVCDRSEPLRIVRKKASGQCAIAAVAEYRSRAGEIVFEIVIGILREQDADFALIPRAKIVPAEMALPLAGAGFAEREKSAHPAVGGAIGGIKKERGTADEIDPAANDKAHAGLFRRFVRMHEARDRMSVRDAERGNPEHRRGREQLFGRGRAAQEREVRGHLKLGIAHASPMPCSHQRPSFAPPSRNSQKRAPSSVSTRK